MTHLFSPLTIKDITIRNRIGMSPMCQYSSTPDGRATDWHMVHLGSRAVGGVGLIIAEATAVSPEGRITPRDAGLWKDDQIEPLQRVNAYIKKFGAVPAVQLAHAGRKAGSGRPWEGGTQLKDGEGGWQPIGPTDEPFGNRLWREPQAMDTAEIERVQAAFVAATERALAAGYEMVELHGAHGYLHHSFLSPLSNTRTDEYGGSFENRTRFMRETVRRMRAVWPERLPFAVRLSAEDWMDGGWTADDSVALADMLKEEGVDLIDCSSGGAARGPRTADPGPGWQVPLASRVRNEAGILSAAVGEITAPAQADTIVRTGQADMVLLARELMRRPNWTYAAAVELGADTAEVIPPQLHHWIG